MIVRELVTRLGFKTDHAAIARAERGFASIKRMALGVTAATAAIGGVLFAITKNIIDTGDRLDEAAQSAGMGTTELQRLGHSAKMSGVEMDSLVTAAGRASRNISDAAKGTGTAKDAFAALGIKLKDGHGKLRAVDDVMMQVADKFEKMPDGTKKTALAIDLFGRAGAALIPMLNQGSKAIKEQGDELEALGGVLSPALIKRAAAVADQIDKLKMAWLGVKVAIAEGVLPVLEGLFKKWLEWLKDPENQKLMREKIAHAMEVLGSAAKVLLKIIEKLGDAFNWVSDKVGGSENALYGLAAAMGAVMATNFVFAIANIASAAGMVAKAIGLIGTAISATFLLSDLFFVAIVGGLLLIADAFDRGSDSILAKFGKKMEQQIPAYKKLVDGIAQTIVDFELWMNNEWPQIWDGAKNAVKVFVDAAAKIIGQLKDHLVDLFNFGNLIPGWGAIKFAIEHVVKNNPEMAQNVANAGATGTLPSMPTPGVAPGMGQAAPITNNSVDIQSKVEVHVESGADADDIARAVEDKVTDVLESTMRKTFRANEAGAY